MEYRNYTYDRTELAKIFENFSNNPDLKHTDVELLPFDTASQPNDLGSITDIDGEKMFMIFKTEILKMLDEVVKNYCKEGDNTFTWEEFKEIYNKIIISFCNLSE